MGWEGKVVRMETEREMRGEVEGTNALVVHDKVKEEPQGCRREGGGVGRGREKG